MAGPVGLAAFIIAAAAPWAAAAAPGRPAVDYVPPVVAPVIDPYRPPPTPYARGNRGIEYATVPGTPVLAAGAGVVVFAGRVGSGLHVTVRHPDGVRTSYSFLALVLVRVGQHVDHRVAVGLAGARLHVGARRGTAYIDPAGLWMRGPPHVFLVSLGGAAPAAAWPRNSLRRAA